MLSKDENDLAKNCGKLHKNILIIESAISNTDDTKVVLLYSILVYFCKSIMINIMCIKRHSTFSKCSKFQEISCHFETYLHYERTLSLLFVSLDLLIRLILYNGNSTKVRI